MMLSIIKFFHVICGVSFFGITIATFFYITQSINKHDQALIDYSIRASYFGDAIILLCIFIQITTSIPLVTSGHFPLEVPWIFIAYHAFGFLIILWLLTLLIKKFYFSRKVIALYSLKSFYSLNIAMILIFIIIIHDAVTQSTGLEFLFRK
ncbi:DUF2269 family protein [Legionella sp.]|uniref:DUF2269 family protein n=1 Tax=Legionella sp. TaxID=459 RepID=UPI003CBF90EA